MMLQNGFYARKMVLQGKIEREIQLHYKSNLFKGLIQTLYMIL